MKMSFNFVETLLDKLLFPSHGDKEIVSRKFSGSQNLMGTNVRMNSNLVSDFHQLLDSDYFTPNVPVMNMSTGVKNNFHYFESSNHSLLSRVPKLFSPSFSTFQGLHIFSNHAEFLFPTEYCSSRRSSILNETLDQLDLFKPNAFNIKKPHKVPEMLGDSANVSPAFDTSCVKPAADVAQDTTLPDDTAVSSQKQIIDSCQTLNQELINRKERELNKRSKKRRRRQKKNKSSNSKRAVENSNKPILNTGNVKSSSQIPLSESLSVNCDILCDIVSIAGQANEVQIILPDLPTFVISVESGDDDADWDACSDSEWLTECAEFELSGLFVANLSAPRINNCSVNNLVSRLDVPLNHEDREVSKLRNMLLNVNKAWNETTKELDRKPKLPSKISFAPEDKLVQVLPVENYERKGEWETYALERMRFKKRIDELEIILSPCLTEKHRSKVFNKLNQTFL